MISPCKNKCTRDEMNNCKDCGRTAWEIARWETFTEEERMNIMARVTGNYLYSIDAEELRRKREGRRPINYNE